jgi:hypothetical protein
MSDFETFSSRLMWYLERFPPIYTMGSRTRHLVDSHELATTPLPLSVKRRLISRVFFRFILRMKKLGVPARGPVAVKWFVLKAIMTRTARQEG